MRSNRCLYSTCQIICWFVFLILSGLTAQNTHSSYSGIGYLLDNWSQSPLISIYPTYDNCQEGEESLIHYIWPGSSKGCDCTNIENPFSTTSDFDELIPTKKMYKGSECTFFQILEGCIDVPSTKKTIFDRFPDQTGKPIKLCGKRSGSPYLLTTGLDCQAGQIKCGSDNQFYCTTDPQCPITSFGFSKDAPKDSQQIKIDKEIFWTSNDAKNLPIVEIRVAEGDGVCIKNKERSVTKDRTDYELMKTLKTDCDRDPRFVEFYSTNEKAYYQANSQVIDFEKLSGFPISDDINWGLYYRENIIWKNGCRPKVMEQFIQYGILLSLINLMSILILVICVLIFVGLFFIIQWMSKWPDHQSDWIEFDFDDSAKHLYKKEFAIKFTIYLSILFLLVLIIVPLKLAGKFLGNFNSCSDDFTNITLSAFSHQLEEADSFNLSFLMICLIICLLDLALHVSYIIRLYYAQLGNSATYEPIQEENNQLEQNA